MRDDRKSGPPGRGCALILALTPIILLVVAILAELIGRWGSQ